jgi:hypothetical protein
MNTIYKSKEQMRQESEKALKKFLKSGGVIQVDTRKRKAPKGVMRSKSSRGFIAGSSGFAVGFPSKSFV